MLTSIPPLIRLPSIRNLLSSPAGGSRRKTAGSNIKTYLWLELYFKPWANSSRTTGRDSSSSQPQFVRLSCYSSPMHLLIANRSGSRRDRRILLAQGLLGLPHEKPRRSSEAPPRPPDRQPRLRHRDVRVGMAARVPRRHGATSKHRGAIDYPAHGRSGCGVVVSGYQSGALLYHCFGSVFLGL